jgi:S1-C subfamily serine protease
MAGDQVSPKYIAILALIAGLILFVGSLLRPRSQDSEQPVSQTELTRLRRAAQRASLDQLSDFFFETAADYSRYVLRMQGTETSGVVWDDQGGIVTATRGGRVPEMVSWIAAGGLPATAHTVAASPLHPIALLESRTMTASMPPARRTTAGLKGGDWVLAIARDTAGNYIFAPGWHGGASLTTCKDVSFRSLLTDLSLSEGMLGGGVFSKDGELVGIIVQCGDSYAAMVVEDAETMVGEARSTASQFLWRFGIGVAALDTDLRAYFNTGSGLLVHEVWKDYPAEVWDLAPGDILISLREQTLYLPNDLEPLLKVTSENPVRLEVLRNGRRSVRTVPEPQPASGAAAGIVLAEPTGYVVERVEPSSPAGLAGMQPGDRVLRIGNVEVARAEQVRTLLTSATQRPTFVVVDRGNRRVGILIR